VSAVGIQEPNDIIVDHGTLGCEGLFCGAAVDQLDGCFDFFLHWDVL
jgi:hypothetical protein